MRRRNTPANVFPMTHTLPGSAAAATASVRRSLRLAGHLDAVSHVHSRGTYATRNLSDGLVWNGQAHTRRDADAIADALRAIEWVADVRVYRFDDGAPMFVSYTSHAFRRNADGVRELVAPEPAVEAPAASDAAPAVVDEPAAHTLSWWRNGTPRKVLGGRMTQHVGTTEARAVCSCGWQGSRFSTRDVEFYRVVGEREFAEHERATSAASDAAPAVDEPTIDELIAELDLTIPAPQIHANREAWLTAATDALRPLFEQLASVELPADVRVSCGFPGGKSPAKVIGQCWYTADDDAPQVFVSPILVDPVDVLGVLVHELVHAWDRGKSGHKAAFARVAKALGLVGKMTATTVGDELRPVLVDLAAELGAYPHAKLSLAAASLKKQSTRMLKVECPACGYTLRTTAKWLEVGVPTCPCGTGMESDA